MITYQETLEYLYSRLPMYQRIGKVAFKKDLTNTLALLEGIGNPHRKSRFIHIAGTNGKGTSAHAVAAVLQKSGYKTGLYTSPHLKNFTERIRINGKEIPQSKVVKFIQSNRELIEKINPSFFEVTVAMAFDYFANENVDIGVIETGLGGRLDSTNVIVPEVTLITSIGLDHTDLLGETIDKIAFEKAGIIKKNIPVVVGEQQVDAMDVIVEVAEKNQSKLVKSRPKKHSYVLNNAPPYFELNLPGILGVIDELRIKGWDISEKGIKNGLENFQSLTGLKGRFQVLSERPTVVADVSHNREGLEILFEGMAYGGFENLHVIFGTVKDKPLKEIIEVLPKTARYYVTQSSVPRSLPYQELQTFFNNKGLDTSGYENVNSAKKAALENAADNDFILITGSTFVVAEIDEL